MWKGAISFGLVHVPINMHTATEQKNVKFKYLHKECHSPIEYKKFCSNCNREVDWHDIVKGYEYEKGKFVVMDEKDLEMLPDEQEKTIDILEFVQLEEIDPVYYNKTYYLSPQETGGKAYKLLQDALSQTSRVAICKMVMRSRGRLACLRVYDGVLTLETMFFPDEVRSFQKELLDNKNVNINAKEQDLAQQIIDHLTAPFDPGKYTDEYREAMLNIIHAKIQGEEVKIPATKADDQIIDLMEALKESVKIVEEEAVPTG